MYILGGFFISVIATASVTLLSESRLGASYGIKKNSSRRANYPLARSDIPITTR